MALTRPTEQPAPERPSLSLYGQVIAPGSAMKNCRRNRNLTQGEVAAKAKIDRTRYSRIEADLIIPGPEETARIWGAFSSE